ncbi:MAG: hypothetical protein JOZ18_02750 [Chloroflexi bacterium]|nr:hypothetical protein [Chloroflexota bacterium]
MYIFNVLSRIVRHSILLASILLVSCSGFSLGGGGTSTKSAPTQVTLGLAKLHWCGKPLMLFRDENTLVSATASPGTVTAASTVTAAPTAATTLPPANGTPTTITDWVQVKANLGFTVYLPATLPAGTCLVSVSGTLRDPLLGSSFIIGFLLPDHDSISLSEAPLRSQNPEFQCNVSSNTTVAGGGTKGGATPTVTPAQTQVPVQLCTGARDTTNIVFSARGTTDALQKFFRALQPDVNWIPAS